MVPLCEESMFVKKLTQLLLPQFIPVTGYMMTNSLSDVMIYTGEGRIGNQTLTVGNKAIYEAKDKHIE